MADAPQILEGHLSVTAAIEARHRDIHQVLIDSEKRFDRRTACLRRAALSTGIELEYVDGERIQTHVSGRTHGGVIAMVGERRFQSLAELLPSDGAPLIVMLDGVEDPYNFGLAMRALYAAGVDGVVLRPRNWTSASDVVGRSSAGAVERMPIALAESAEEAADFFQGRGLMVATTAKSPTSLPLFDVDLTQPLLILVGGERRGVARSFQKRADILMGIPYGRHFGQAVGTVSAVSIIAFEAMRQRLRLGV